MMNAVRKIRILLDERSFEYDIYTLVIAFFQGAEVHVFDPGDLPFREADLTVEVNASGRDARILVEENPAEPAAQEAPAESPAAQENPTECPSVQEVPAECPDAQERPAEKPFREERIMFNRAPPKRSSHVSISSISVFFIPPSRSWPDCGACPHQVPSQPLRNSQAAAAVRPQGIPRSGYRSWAHK